MKCLDLFSGTRSIALAFESAGWDTFSVELDRRFKDIDLYADVMTVTAEDILRMFGHPDVIWASVPCEAFSVASIPHYWTKGSNTPKTEKSRAALNLLEHTVQLIKDLSPTFYFIENPRGMMRKMECLKNLPRYTVTYCQYGDFRQKPTDIWTNHPDPQFKPMCRPHAPCHQPAPRGTSRGTQSIRGTMDRSRVPDELCHHIVNICIDGINKSL